MIDDSAVVSRQHDCICFVLFVVHKTQQALPGKVLTLILLKTTKKCICKYYIIRQVNLVEKKQEKLFSGVLTGCISLYDIGFIYHHKKTGWEEFI